MKKIMLTLVLVMACAVGTVFAQPRAHRYHRHMHYGPRYSYYDRGPYYHSDFGSFIIGAAIGAVIDHAITKAVTSEPVVVERTVIVDRDGYPVDQAGTYGYPIEDAADQGYPIGATNEPVETVRVEPGKKVIVVEEDTPVVIVGKSTPVMIFDDNGFHFETHPQTLP